MIIIGIDPGAKGGIAGVGGSPWALPMPMSGNEVNATRLVAILKPYPDCLCVVEKQQVFGVEGRVSCFTTGQGYGTIIGVLLALQLHTELVLPPAWKKLILAGTLKDKGAAIAYCGRAYPGVPLIIPPKRTPSDGLADALCIAEYGRRTYLREPPSPAG